MGGKRKPLYQLKINESPDLDQETIAVIATLMYSFTNEEHVFIKCPGCGKAYPEALIAVDQRPYPEMMVCRTCKTAINFEKFAKSQLTTPQDFDPF